jgi:hypothetical protein
MDKHATRAVLAALIRGCRKEAARIRCTPFELGPGYAHLLRMRHEIGDTLDGASLLVDMARDLGVAVCDMNGTAVASIGDRELIVPSLRFGAWLTAEYVRRFGDRPDAEDAAIAQEILATQAAGAAA